jgi:mannose-6-phosphate isomerase class I
MISTNNRDLYDLMNMKRSHGLARVSERFVYYQKQSPEIEKSFLFVTDGYNFRNTEFGAVLGLSQLNRLDKFIENRRETYQLFVEVMSQKNNVEKFYPITYHRGNSCFCFPFICKTKEIKSKLISLLNEYPVKQGDVFFLETGTIHAIGAGVVVAEIQQTSDITYRIYDWDRVDANGKGRELHTDLALEAINFNTTNSKMDYSEVPNESSQVVNCPYFNTNIIALQDHYIWKKSKESFTVFMCTNGQFEVIINGEIMQYKMGDTILIPAIIDSFTLKGKATLLEISI